MMNHLPAIFLVFLLAGCLAPDDTGTDKVPTQAPETTEPETAAQAAAPTEPVDPAARLRAVLAAQTDDVQARYAHRHPAETLEFFDLQPGMTVLEALPGSGWYTRILLAYLGAQGHLIGANYELDVWPNFNFGTEEFIATMRAWPETFPVEASQWCEDDCARISAHDLGQLPATLDASVDAVLFIRTLHNLARFQHAGISDFLDRALADAFRVLKPGGIFGVVQHQAREDMPDDWADGSNGYLKKSFVIEKIEAAGFELIGTSPINENPADQPTSEEFVWRLPPSLRSEDQDPETIAALQAIGESHRMTLKFRKPQDGQ